MYITLPVYVWLKPFIRARRLSLRRKVTHHGIVYFYILMAWTIVLNLLEVREKSKLKDDEPNQFLIYTNATIMALSLIAMLYIAWATREEVIWAIHRINLSFYFRTGLYVFGVANMVYTSLKLYDNFSCKEGRNILLNISQFLFIVSQILFHNYFYQAKLPGRGWLMQVCLAHILGTNLSLWIRTICKKVLNHSKKKDDCSPIPLGDTEKFFYPLFVEYLLLVAGMVYELWVGVVVPRDTRRRAGHWIDDAYHGELQNPNETPTTLSNGSRLPLPVDLVSERRRHIFAPSLAFSFLLGLAICSIFFSFMLAAHYSAWKEERHSFLYDNFVIANICVYCTQLIACYVIKVCGQSQPADRKRTSFNLDDFLLYLGLAGVILWEGFHLYFVSYKPKHKAIYFVHSLLGQLEFIVQTVILVSARRLSSREDKNAQTISNMSLFLLATNFAFWILNSFLIDQRLSYPGESHHREKEENLLSMLQFFAYILNPIVIFFRFHSAACCYQMWLIFSRPVMNNN
ncbi:proton channel OtopLc-like [Dendronephthya gigantea]|uniref:proton channel OtopLc-like n=1 Tax=Dendronephthya gigantea TaxID=151771 RepID=UPI00106A836E|nr:proton channel OtopLc-like [Dendronephthya gigantea]